MGRAPCCDKANVKKGPWSPEEDAKLKDYIEKNGTGGNWIALPQKAGLRRCGKSCRLRWLNYLRPNIRHGEFSEEEDRVICSLYATIGSRWSIIAAQLPGRTDNDIKNYWNTKLKKKLMAFATSSSSSSTFNGTSFHRATTGSSKPPLSLYSSSNSDDQLSSLYSYSYAPNSHSSTTKQLKPNLLMDEPPSFSCHQMITSSGITTGATTTSSCLESSTLSLFQNQQQYYQPLLMFGSSTATDHQQTSCSSNNSDNGGINKHDNILRSFQSFNNKSSSDNNNVVIANGFDEEDEINKGFMLSGYEDQISNNVFMSQFDSSTDHAPPLMDLYDIEGGNNNKQLSMNINNLSLINIGDNQQEVVNSKINSLDQPMMKEKDQRMMMMYMYYFNSNYDC